MKRLENVLFGSLYDPIEFGKEDEEKVQDEAETGSAMYFVRDDKNSHGDGYPRRFSPFGEDLHTNVCSINNEDVSLSLLQRSLLLPTLDFSFFFSLCMRSQKYVRDAGGFAGVNPPMPKLAQVAAPSGTLTALLWANVGSRIALNGSGSCAHSLGDGYRLSICLWSAHVCRRLITSVLLVPLGCGGPPRWGVNVMAELVFLFT
ncbi:hypothetical protein WN943_027152 [Citrus x changshan-huyou]